MDDMCPIPSLDKNEAQISHNKCCHLAVVRARLSAVVVPPRLPPAQSDRTQLPIKLFHPVLIVSND